MATVSFATDIMPYFKQYQAQMRWRFDLTSYEEVKANAQLIYFRINSKDSPMPPAPFEPFPQTVIDNFKTWIDEGYPP